MIKPTSLKDFYNKTLSPQPDRICSEIGHFNVFRIKDLNHLKPDDAKMFYNRKTFYKVALLVGRTLVKYADREINVEHHGLLFADPTNPYQFDFTELEEAGYFCIFSTDFVKNSYGNTSASKWPIFSSNLYPVFNITIEQKAEIESIFELMRQEINSEYAYKYDLIRTYLIQLVHYGQKLLPEITNKPVLGTQGNIYQHFLQLMEQEFSINLPLDRLVLKLPRDYAKKLCIHVNYLNKKLKEATGQSTTELLNERMLKESKILLKYDDWSISQIAYGLGFQDGSHFSKFFKKQLGYPPLHYRSI
ncbi:AraC family transcriptional regulator [Pedobacter sp. BMA]|uniref:helix-turn-helix domain-containing protein n=1 Tax=Pedobacter sp. BMA TaxID=1663685 RepID=UPI00064A7B91|nr:helix-turn-helix domain-containing protein [Pedobacter sp. BMA]KLT67056.1 hypothetical protein AB669_03890 [Pedobacter sp. BMA]